MCLNYIRDTRVSDGTVECWKVFVYKPEDGIFTSPFRHMALVPIHYRDEARVPYTAERTPDMLTFGLYEALNEDHGEIIRGRGRFSEFTNDEMDFIFKESVLFNDSCEGGFVHAYTNLDEALKELRCYYANSFDTSILVKCTIPEGEEYYLGQFDGDNIDALATRKVLLSSVVELYSQHLYFHVFGASKHVFGASELCLQKDYPGERSLQKDMEYIRQMIENTDIHFDFVHHDGTTTAVSNSANKGSEN